MLRRVPGGLRSRPPEVPPALLRKEPARMHALQHLGDLRWHATLDIEVRDQRVEHSLLVEDGYAVIPAQQLLSTSEACKHRAAQSC
jgi:hypothetical protein|eukprot:5749633-Prymnesium_polylepis.1